MEDDIQRAWISQDGWVSIVAAVVGMEGVGKIAVVETLEDCFDHVIWLEVKLDGFLPKYGILLHIPKHMDLWASEPRVLQERL